MTRGNENGLAVADASAYDDAMPKTAYRPILRPFVRTDAKAMRIARAVKAVARLRASDPGAYRSLLEKNAHRAVRIVAG